MTIPLLGPELPIVQQTRDALARQRNPLYLPAQRISAAEFSSLELGALVERMREVMRAKGGIGIAANQLGLSLQVFLLEARPDNPRYQVLGEVPFSLFINPRLVAASKERRNFWHGCLSAEGEARGNLATYEWIEFAAAEMDGREKTGRLEGLAAVIFQHELRHLLGGTYLDKALTLLPKAELDERLEKKELPFFERAAADLPLLLGDYQIGETLEEYYSRQARASG